MRDRSDRSSGDGRVPSRTRPEPIAAQGGLSRRGLLGASVAATTLLAGCTDALSGDDAEGADGSEDDAEGADDGEDDADEGGAGVDDPVAATVTLEPDATSDWTVSDGIFGRFAENYGDNEIHPGLYAEYLTNTCFVDWEDGLGEPSYLYPADDVAEADGLPFPWQPIGDDADVDFERPDEGGVRPDADGNRTHQRVLVSGGEGGVSQRIVLPDWRTLGYHCSLSVRGEGVDALEIRLTGPDGEQLAAETVPVTGSWERHEDVHLELSEPSGSDFRGAAGGHLETPFGEYVLELVVEGEGRVDLDWLSLVPDDAVEGRYNPSTLELMADRNVTLLKWPGGNYTSQYHWEDGVGPVVDRPVIPNLAWDGLDPNLMGTAEYVECCELAGAEPTITVGVTVEGTHGAAGDYRSPPEPITPEEAANWVEYCNGDADTEYGALRAEHGYEEPFEIELWEVGNEVWGPWQMGGTDDPEAFVDLANEFAAAMKAVDDSITVTFDAMDPVNVEPELPDPEEWNDTVFAEGENFDGVDVHRYDWGIRAHHGGDAARENWLEENDAEPVDYAEVLVAFPSQFDEELEGLADEAAAEGHEDFQIVMGEWGLFPEVSGGWPFPGMDTMAGASYVAGMFNAFLRRGEHVRRASHTHMPVRLFPPVAAEYPPDPNPLLPTGRTHALYAEPFESDAEWRLAEAPVEGDTRDLPEMGYLIRPMADVTYLDAAAIRSDDGECYVFATNRNLRAPCECSLEVPDALADADVTVSHQRPTDDPFEPQTTVGDAPDSWLEWDDLEGYELVEETADLEDGALALELRPAGVVRIHLEP